MSLSTIILGSNVSSSLKQASSDPAKDKAKLHDAGQQFEALMIGEMMKSVRQEGSGWLGSGETTESESAFDFAEAQFAKALASSGGLGLSKMIEQSMGKQLEDQNEKTSPIALSGHSLK